MEVATHMSTNELRMRTTPDVIFSHFNVVIATKRSLPLPEHRPARLAACLTDVSAGDGLTSRACTARM